MKDLPFGTYTFTFTDDTGDSVIKTVELGKNRVKSSIYNEIKNWLVDYSQDNITLNLPFGGVGKIVDEFKHYSNLYKGYQYIREKLIDKKLEKRDKIVSVVRKQLGFEDLSDEDAFKFSEDIAAEYWECFNKLLDKKMSKEFVEKFITSLKVEDQEEMLNGNFFYKEGKKLVVNPFYDVILKGKIFVKIKFY